MISRPILGPLLGPDDTKNRGGKTNEPTKTERCRAAVVLMYGPDAACYDGQCELAKEYHRGPHRKGMLVWDTWENRE